MSKGWKFAFLIMLLILLPLCAFAHSGDTDWRGGHADSSTGKYHYHHGYPAHDHWDMDGDGDIDCPYLFDDKTGQNSGASGFGTGTGNGGASSSSMYENGYEKGKTDGYNDGYDDGWLDGYDKGYAQAETDLEGKYEDEIKGCQVSAVIATAVVIAIVGIPIVLYLAGRGIEEERERCRKEIAKVKQEQLDDRNLEILRRIDPDAAECIKLPDGVKLDLKCIPMKGRVTAERPYGDFTAYISTAGKRYHYRKGCSNANTIIHVLERPSGLTPCSVCIGRDSYESAPDWYLQIIGSGRKTAATSTEKEQAVKEATQTSTSSYSKLKSVQSICISKLDYQAGVLYITISGGGTYAYYNVPKDVFDGLIKAQSPGKYFHEKINGAYPYAPYHE